MGERAYQVVPWKSLMWTAAPYSGMSGSSPHPVVNCTFSYADVDIDFISVQLKICWEMLKTVLRTSGAYLGFLWNLDTWVIHLLEEKKAKYLAAITEWQSKWTHDLLLHA